MHARRAPAGGSFLEILVAFLRLGATAFGGPAGHLALMHRDLVHRRGWFDEQRFFATVATSHLLPGPNSTQAAIHMGYLRGGARGAVAAGAGFILPGTVLVVGLTALYAGHRDLEAFEPFSAGVQAVVVGIVVAALLPFALRAARGWRSAAVMAGAAALAAAGAGPLAPILLGASAGLVAALPARRGRGHLAALLAPWPVAGVVAAGEAAAGTPSLARLGLLFLRFAVTLFGSGYLLLAYVEEDLVVRHQLLTVEQLIELVAIGAAAPGPLFTTAAAIGYVLAGLPGAAVLTVAVFAPSFVMVLLLGRWLPGLERSPVVRSTLRGLLAAVVGVMLVTVLGLAGDVAASAQGVGLATGAAALSLRYRASPPLMVLAGGAAGALLW